MKKFFEQPRTPNECLAKLMEEVGEVAEAHSQLLDQLGLMVTSKKDSKRLSQSTKRILRHLDQELADVERVARFWREQMRDASTS